MAYLALVFLFVLLPTIKGQEQPQEPTSKTNVTSPDRPTSTGTIVLSGVATTGRIADANERIVFNGWVMRVADFVAAVSSSNEAVLHLRTPEKHNHEKDQPAPPLKP